MFKYVERIAEEEEDSAKSRDAVGLLALFMVLLSLRTQKLDKSGRWSLAWRAGEGALSENTHLLPIDSCISLPDACRYLQRLCNFQLRIVLIIY